MTLSGNGIALRSDLQPVGRRRLVVPASVVREGASTLLEALGGLFRIDEGVLRELRYLRALGFCKNVSRRDPNEFSIGIKHQSRPRDAS